MTLTRSKFNREAILKTLDRNCKDLGILVRPNAGNGFWLAALLPAAYAINAANNPCKQFEYKLSTIISFGLLLQSIEIFVKLCAERLPIVLHCVTKLSPGAVCSFLVWICLKQGIVFSLVSGYLPAFLYNGLLLIGMKRMTKCFTLGEISIVVQGLVIFLYNSYIQVPYLLSNPPSNESEKMTAVMQIGVVGVSLMIALVSCISALRRTVAFYLVLSTTIVLVMVFPVTPNLPVVELFEFIFFHPERLFFTSYLIGLLGCTVVVVWWQVSRNQSSTTTIRKTFHLLIVLVYIPGLLIQCTYLFVASVVIFSIFLVMELARVIRLYPVADCLNSSVQAFIDEKDAGGVALTPLYLLAGISSPLWLHPCSCDLSDSSIFNFLPLASGVISVGIGDTAASFFGSKFGRHKWPTNSSKSVEGTIANMIVQGLAIFVFIQLGAVPSSFKNYFISTISVITTSVIEATTDQVDNLILPLISFLICSL